jgi:uncharacterized protein (TIGR02996 family)
MNHERAFLQAIQDEPDDDAQRLIYADWLDDNDRPERAAFIRAQVRLAALPEEDSARLALEDEADDLLEAHEEEWAAPLRGLALEWEWRRGFIERATMRGSTFLDRGDHLFAAAPLRDLRLLVESRDLPELAQSPHLNWLEALDLSLGGELTPESCRNFPLRDRAVQALLESPYLTHLAWLNLSGHILEGPAVLALARCSWFANLTYLDLSYTYLGDRGSLALLSARAESLRVLRLRSTNLTRTGALTLFGATNMPNLRELDIDLRRVLCWPTRDPLHELRELLRLPLLGRLELLNLQECQLNQVDAVRELAHHPRLPGVTKLDLSGNGFGVDGALALAESPHLSGLRSLRLRNNSIRDTGTRALVGAPGLQKLRALDLAQNRIDGPGIRTLAEAPGLAGLRQLDLSDNFVGVPNARALANSTTLTGLTRLALSGAGLDNEAVRALAEAPALARLRSLDLGANLFDGEAARALASSPHLRRLRELELRDTPLLAAGAEALLRSRCLSRRIRLDLRGASISATEWARLRRLVAGRHVLS